jgi:hypothetical protein
MLTTWIEAPVKGRLGGPVRAGGWSAAVVGTYPIALGQRVWIELYGDDQLLGHLPGYWIQEVGVNNLWHVPFPPVGVEIRLRYRALARQNDGPIVSSPFQEILVRPNVPGRDESPAHTDRSPEGLVGNRMMTVRVDERGATHDILFPTVGLHSDVRPANGDQKLSRAHFRTIVGGLAAGPRIDWFCERRAWDASQQYEGATNVLTTKLRWRQGPIRVIISDFAAIGPNLPQTAAKTVAGGQYVKRFRIHNDGDTPLNQVPFGLFVHSEVNGGIGDPGLSWQDVDRTLVATNRGHTHANRKLARDATIEFALTLDGRAPVSCEAIGPSEAILLRPVDVPARGATTIDLLVSGAFTGWRGDTGTFNHWIRPALSWFRSADMDQVKDETLAYWDEFVEKLPSLSSPVSVFAGALCRSALAAAIHVDSEWGAVASGFEPGLRAYCWPRDAVIVGGVLDRLGHFEIGAKTFQWLKKVRKTDNSYPYWFQKYTIDGWPEWETPGVDQTALIPWGIERHYRRTGDRAFLADQWEVIEQAASVCAGDSGHPGLRLIEGLDLVASAGPWDNRFGAFLYSNACVVAGLRSAARLAAVLERSEKASAWHALAERIWNRGILGRVGRDGRDPGLVDRDTGRFLEARRISLRRGLWCENTEGEGLAERSDALTMGLLAPAVPLGLIPASDPVVRATAEALLRSNRINNGGPNWLARWSRPAGSEVSALEPLGSQDLTASCMATLWMARYLIQLGRETAEASAWTRAVAFLTELLGRLGPLGLELQQVGRAGGNLGEFRRELAGATDLHAGMIDTLLDLAGLDHDVPSGCLILDPVLPTDWPFIGLTQDFRCGSFGYRLERVPGSAGYRLTIESDLSEPTMLQIGITCPGLNGPGVWKSRPATPAPCFKEEARRMSWTVELPAGRTVWEWAWGGN